MMHASQVAKADENGRRVGTLDRIDWAAAATATATGSNESDGDGEMRR